MSLFEHASNKVICEWKIDNYHFFPNESLLTSPIFHMNQKDTIPNTKWCLEILPSDTKSGNILCYLMRVFDFGPEIIKLCYEISVVAYDGSCRRLTFAPNPASFGKDSYDLSVQHLGHEIDVNAFLVDGTLTLRCQMGGFDALYPVYCLIRTHSIQQKMSCKWNIDGLGSLKMKEYRFSYRSVDDDLTFRLQVSWSGEEIDDAIHIEISRYGSLRHQLVIGKISLLDDKGNVAAHKKDKYCFSGESVWNFPSSMKKKWLLDNKDLCVPNDTLTLWFEIETCKHMKYLASVAEIHFEDLSKLTSFISEYSTSSIQSPPTSSGSSSSMDVTDKVDHFEDVSDCVLGNGSASTTPPFESNSLIKGLLALYQQRKFCDVTLKTNENTYTAHKAVLCAQSPVFTAMFDQDMNENLSGIVEIKDLTDDTLQRLLMFMYTDTLQDIQWESALKLYTASVTYEISRLKNLCRSFLKTNINVSNVIDALVLADLHHDSDLKSASLDFVAEHDSELIDSDMWKRFMQERLKLAAELMHLLYLRKIKV